MQWTNPLYISQNIEKDSIAVKVEPKVFELDPSALMSKKQSNEYKY